MRLKIEIHQTSEPSVVGLRNHRQPYQPTVRYNAGPPNDHETTDPRSPYQIYAEDERYQQKSGLANAGETGDCAFRQALHDLPYWHMAKVCPQRLILDMPFLHYSCFPDNYLVCLPTKVCYKVPNASLVQQPHHFRSPTIISVDRSFACAFSKYGVRKDTMVPHLT